MDRTEKKQKLPTSDITSPSLSKKKKRKITRSSSDLKRKKEENLTTSSQILSASFSKEELREAMKKQNDVALVLTSKVIASCARNSNLIISPASINAAVTMMAAGTDRSSDMVNAVYSEIATVVFTDGSATGGPKISAINSVWVDQSEPVDQSLKDLLENVFKATFAQVDFQSKAEQVRIRLNKWGSDQTNGLIRDLLPPGSVSRETIKICGNALYFKGVWEDKFSKSLTKDREFNLLSGEQVQVAFMKSYENQYITAYNGFKVLRMPYKQGDGDTDRKFSMCVYLPDKKDGLNDLVEEMTSTPGFLDSHIPKYKVLVGDFRIPKFKISFMFDASSVLEKDVSMSLYHKALVEIDEEGAVAAAVTFCGKKVGLSCHKPPPPKLIDFVADHPFLFLIREDSTGTVLFAGQIFDPR